MTDNPLRELAALGQSVWLDFIRRGFDDFGALTKMDKRIFDGPRSTPLAKLAGKRAAFAGAAPTRKATRT